MYNNPLKFSYSKAFGIVCLICYSVLIFLSVFWVRDMHITGKISESMLPNSHPYVLESNAWYEIFPVENAILLSVSTSDSPLFTVENLSHVASMVEELQENPLIDAVYSITNLKDSDEDSFTEEPFLDIQDQVSIDHALVAIDDIQILRSLFLSTDSRALLIYVIADREAEDQQFGMFLDAFRSQWEMKGLNIAVSGSLFYEYQNRSNIVRDLTFILLFGMAFIGVIYFFFVRNLSVTILLLVNSFIPSLIMFALLSHAGKQIDVMTVLLPLLLFSISTAYSIHYCKTYQVVGNREKTLATVAQVITLSALTTMLGYSNLLFLNSDSMQTLGVSLIIGIMLSVFSVLFCIPVILECFSIGHLGSWEIHLHSSSYPTGKTWLYFFVCYLLVFGFVLCGLYWYGEKWHYRDGYQQNLRSFVPMEEEADAFGKHNGRIQNIDIFIDTGSEYGLISHEVYEKIEEMTHRIRELDAVVSVISYTDITSYGNGILYGQHQEIPPINDAEIGETLELITSYRNDIPLDLFVDQSYERTRLLIGYDVSQARNEHEMVLLYLEILEIIEQTVYSMEGSSYHAAGRPLLLKALNEFFLNFLSKASPLFFLSIFLVGLIILHSIKKGLLLVLPSLLASCFYIGLNAWFKQPISVFNVFGLYTLMGISVDDSFYFLINYKRAENLGGPRGAVELVSEVYHTTGINIIETTLIVSGGLLAALFSGTFPIVMTIAMAILALNFSTITTLYIMPQFFLHTRIHPTELSQLGGVHENSKTRR